jgi:hypothetical protein
VRATQKKDISRECENAVPRGCAPLGTLRAKPRSGESLVAQCVSAGLEHPSPAALKGRKSEASFAPSALDRIFTATQRSRTGLEDSRRFAAFGLLTATRPQPRGTRCRAPWPTPLARPKSLLQATSPAFQRREPTTASIASRQRRQRIALILPSLTRLDETFGIRVPALKRRARLLASLTRRQSDTRTFRPRTGYGIADTSHLRRGDS